MTKIDGNSMNFLGKTDIGKVRATNQDNFFVGSINNDSANPYPLLCVVCDGMGGAAGGSTASKIAISAFYEQVRLLILKDEYENDDENLLITSAVRANKLVFSKSTSDIELSGMGTTLVAALVREEKITVVNIGDSRLYGFKNDKIKQITHDHSFVQELVDRGQITPKQAKNHPNKNIITRALGVDEYVEPDTFTIKEPLSGILLCSDGLSGYVSEEKINELFCGNTTNEELLNLLITEANKAGGKDNITIIAVKFSPKEENVNG